MKRLILLALTLQLSIPTQTQASDIYCGFLGVKNWKAGQKLIYNGRAGLRTKRVMSVEEKVVWLEDDLVDGWNFISNYKVNKTDGSMIKYIDMFGNVKEGINNVCEVVSRSSETINVPAGTFNVIHIVKRTKHYTGRYDYEEVWIDPSLKVLDGVIKIFTYEKYPEVNPEVYELSSVVK